MNDEPTRILADGIPVQCAHDALVPTNELKPNPRNPNVHPKGQIERLAKIIRVTGWRVAIVVSKRSGLITKGHGRLAAARYLDAKLVPVDYQDYRSEEEEWSDIIADNKIAEESERDEIALASLLKDLTDRGSDTTMTGFEATAVSKLLDRAKGIVTADEKAPGASAAEELQAKWKVEAGQLWLCGPHRILCGDSTKPADWARLMAGSLAQVIHTDPPYGIDYEDRKGCEGMARNKAQVANDSLKGNSLAALVRSALKIAVHHTQADAAFYIWHSSSTRRDFEAALDAAGLQERQYITWVKEMIVMGRADYHLQTEPCFYCEKAGKRAKWCGDRTGSTVWRLQKLENDGSAIDLATGLHITDGDKASLFLKAQPPKAGKFRHLRVAGDPVMVANTVGTDAWQVTRDVRADYLHPCLPQGELVYVAGKWTPIEDALAGDETPHGDIMSTSCHIARHIVTVTLEDGSKTRATGNHPFLIARGDRVFWMEARHIKPGDKTLTPAYALNTQKPCHDDQTEKQRTDSFQPKDIAACTTSERSEPGCSTSLSGKLPTDQSPMASTSTTSTETNSTTALKISHLLTPLNTNGFTLVVEKMQQENGKSPARPADNSSQPPPITGITSRGGSTERSAESASAKDKSLFVEFALRTVGSVVHEQKETLVYNLTIDGTPAFDTLIGLSHNTQKPAELAEIAIANSSATNDIVVDCFGGSFSTLVAAENLKRRAYVMDLEPKWCAVGLERWSVLTGKTPELVTP